MLVWGCVVLVWGCVVCYSMRCAGDLPSSPCSQAPSPEDGPQQWTEDHPLNLYVPTRFISYVAMGTVAVEVAPYLYHLLGI